MTTKELVEKYKGKDEEEYVSTVCQSLEKSFPGIEIIDYNHDVKYREHIWSLRHSDWNSVMKLHTGIEALSEIFDAFDETETHISGSYQMREATVEQLYDI